MESMKHKRLKEEAVKWLATRLNVPESRVKTEVLINGRIADVFCDGRVVECGRTRTRRLEDSIKAAVLFSAGGMVQYPLSIGLQAYLTPLAIMLLPRLV